MNVASAPVSDTIAAGMVRDGREVSSDPAYPGSDVLNKRIIALK